MPRAMSTHTNFIDEPLAFLPLSPELAQLADVITTRCQGIQTSIDALSSVLTSKSETGSTPAVLTELTAMREQLRLLTASLDKYGGYTDIY